jgi:hypothetical protein
MAGIFIPNPKARLREQVAEVSRFKRLSPRKEEAYWLWIRRFILYHGKRHPKEMNAPEVTAFLSHLATEEHVAASTQNQALNALVFLYREVLHVPLDSLADSVRARRPPRVPVVLSRDEVRRLLDAMQGTHQLMAQLLYGTGLRLMELLRLRVKDVDFARNQIIVHQGKGDKDRVTQCCRRVWPDRCRSIWSGCGYCINASWRTVSAGRNCPRHLPGSIRTPRGSGRGNGCSHRPRVPSNRTRGVGDGTTRWRRACSGR